MSFGDPLELECQFLRLLRDPLTRLLMDANGVSEADLLALMCRIAAAQSGAAEPASPEQVCRYTALAGTKEREDAMNERPPIYTRKASINRPPRILVVEDETPLAELLAYNIKAEGFQVKLSTPIAAMKPNCVSLRRFSTLSFSIGCCRGYRVLRSVAACGSGTRPATRQSSC